MFGLPLAGVAPHGMVGAPLSHSHPVAGAPAARLTYFAGRGRAELIRYALAAAGIPWTERHLTTREEFVALRDSGVLAFDQVPLVELDGGNMVQCAATVRAIARRVGLYSESPQEAYLIDATLDGVADFVAPCLAFPFKPDRAAAANDAAKALAKGKQTFNRLLQRFMLPGRPPFVTGRFTIADVALAAAVRNHVEIAGGSDSEVLRDAPLLAAHLAAVEAHPRIAAYLRGPQRHGLPDAEYVATVRRVLEF